MQQFYEQMRDTLVLGKGVTMSASQIDGDISELVLVDVGSGHAGRLSLTEGWLYEWDKPIFSYTLTDPESHRQVDISDPMLQENKEHSYVATRGPCKQILKLPGTLRFGLPQSSSICGKGIIAQPECTAHYGCTLTIFGGEVFSLLGTCIEVIPREADYNTYAIPTSESIAMLRPLYERLKPHWRSTMFFWTAISHSNQKDGFAMFWSYEGAVLRSMTRKEALRR